MPLCGRLAMGFALAPKSERIRTACCFSGPPSSGGTPGKRATQHSDQAGDARLS